MKLEEYGARIKANQHFDCVVEDSARLSDREGCRCLVEQEMASADSIATNIEEGYGHSRRREYTQFLVIACGSAQEDQRTLWANEASVSCRIY